MSGTFIFLTVLACYFFIWWPLSRYLFIVIRAAIHGSKLEEEYKTELYIPLWGDAVVFIGLFFEIGSFWDKKIVRLSEEKVIVTKAQRQERSKQVIEDTHPLAGQLSEPRK